MSADRRVPVQRLKGHVDSAALPFESSADLLGEEHLAQLALAFQPRAVAALELAASVRAAGFHAFAAGPAGIGRHEAVRAFLEAHASGLPAPDDWVYVHSFERADEPRPLRLGAGQAPDFAREVDRLLEELRREIPRELEGQASHRRHADLEKEFQKRRRQLVAELKLRVKSFGYTISETRSGLEAVPAYRGRAVRRKEIPKLPASLKRRASEHTDEVIGVANEATRSFQQLEVEHDKRREDLHRDVAGAAADRLLAPLRDKHRDQRDVLDHLRALRDDVLRNLDLFNQQRKAGDEEGAKKGPSQEDDYLRYKVNVFVTRPKDSAAPVVVELRATYQNLLGRIERRMELGALVTDFTRIKAGAAHRANGGFLVLSAADLLSQIGTYEGLKRCLRAGQLFIEDLEALLGLTAAESLRPAPIPLDCRVVMVGEPGLYEMLAALDPEFRLLFGVKADFDDTVGVAPDVELTYSKALAAMCREGSLQPLDRAATARVLEYAMWLAADQRHLSLAWSRVRELLHEADRGARRDGAVRIREEHIERAESEMRHRAGLEQERVLEDVRRRVLVVDVTGGACGSVNGIAVSGAGDYAVGRPLRVTATVGPGRDGIIDIERHARLAGPIHTKAVLILQGFLLGRYAHDRPLSLSAMLTFEQSYSGVEGDSASLAELVALLSALSGLPARQGIALTAAVSQDGRLQPVGAVTEKVEIFFDVCRSRGLEGAQGVVISAANVDHLNLRDDVRASIAEGKFNLWAVESVDEALELVMDKPAGRRGEDGRWPDQTINGMIAHRMAELARAARSLWVGERHQAEPGEPTPWPPALPPLDAGGKPPSK